VCDNRTRVKKQRTDAVNAFKDKDLRSFYVVSYSILIDSGSQPHDFIPPEILSGEEVEDFFKIKIRYGYVNFKFNQTASQMFYARNPFEGLPNQFDDDSCVNFLDSPKMMKTADEHFKVKFKHSIVLLYGCEVYAVHERQKVKKVAILLDNESYDQNLNEIYLKKISGKKHKMTNINYKFFVKRGFCICDAIIDYINCDDDKPESFSIFEAFPTVGLGILATCIYIGVRLCITFSNTSKNESTTQDTENNSNEPTEEPTEEPTVVVSLTEPEPPPIPLLTISDTKRKIEDHERRGGSRLEPLVEENYF
jgi:hypothetical protein